MLATYRQEKAFGHSGQIRLRGKFEVPDTSEPFPMPARSKVLVCCLSPAEIVGSNPTVGGGGMDVFCECYVLTGRGLRVQLIIRPEESYRLWYVVLCDLETS